MHDATGAFSTKTTPPTQDAIDAMKAYVQHVMDFSVKLPPEVANDPTLFNAYYEINEKERTERRQLTQDEKASIIIKYRVQYRAALDAARQYLAETEQLPGPIPQPRFLLVGTGVDRFILPAPPRNLIAPWTNAPLTPQNPIFHELSMCYIGGLQGHKWPEYETAEYAFIIAQGWKLE